MDRFIRAQRKGYSFEDMTNHSSADGGDGMGDEIDGVCACTTIGDLLVNTVMDALNTDDDVIVFEGVFLAHIYDGVRVRPVREIARFSVADLLNRPELIGEEI